MWSWLMDPTRLNLLLNFASVILGGGLVAAILTHSRGLKQLTGAEEADIRGHWASEVKALRERLDAGDKRYMDLLEKFDEHREQSELRYQQAVAYHDQCVAERAELRSEMEGLKRQLAAQSTDRVLLMEENCGKPSLEAPHSLAAAKRLKEGDNERR
jgi:hypothetical protein